MIAGLLHNGSGPRENVDLTGLTREEFDLLRSMYPLNFRLPFPTQDQVRADLSRTVWSVGTDAIGISTAVSARRSIEGYSARQFECLLEVVRRANRSAEVLGEASADDIFAALSVPLAVTAGKSFGKPLNETALTEEVINKIQAGMFQYRRTLERGMRENRKSNNGKANLT